MEQEHCTGTHFEAYLELESATVAELEAPGLIAWEVEVYQGPALQSLMLRDSELVAAVSGADWQRHLDLELAVELVAFA